METKNITASLIREQVKTYIDECDFKAKKSDIDEIVGLVLDDLHSYIEECVFGQVDSYGLEPRED